MTTEPIAGPAIRVQGLQKSYKKLEVLRGVDLDARGAAFSRLRQLALDLAGVEPEVPEIEVELGARLRYV